MIPSVAGASDMAQVTTMARLEAAISPEWPGQESKGSFETN